MNVRRSILLAMLLGPAAVPAEAATAPGATTTVFVPIVLSAGGVPPSFYTSEITLTNRGTTAASVSLAYTAAFGGGSGEATDELGAGRQIVEADAIEYLRRLGVPIPDSGSRGGTLRVTFSGLSSPADGSVTVRTTTAVAEGRAGLAYSGLDVRALPSTPYFPVDPLSLVPYAPTNYGSGDVFPSPAPSGAPASRLSVFDGTGPNGTWSLWIVTDSTPASASGGDIGSWCLDVTTTGGKGQFCSSQLINIASRGSASPPNVLASPYPATLAVSGLSGTVTRVSVTFRSPFFDRPDCADILLSGPSGQSVVLLSDAGGTGDVDRSTTLVFDDVAATLFLTGLRQNAADRSNVAILNGGAPGDGDVTLRLTLISGSRTAPSSTTLPDETLPPGGFKQLSGILDLAGLASGYVKVERIAGTAPFFAYAVINDQGTSDGSYIPGVLLGGDGDFVTQTIPAVVESGPFTTEVVITNTSSVSKLVSLRYVAEAVTTSDDVARTTLNLAAGEQLVIPSYLQYLRDQRVNGAPPAGTSAAGALFVSDIGGDRAGGLMAAARTSSPGGAGRYGVFYPAIPSPRLPTSAAWLPGLLQDARNRTNLAIVNTGESGSSTFSVELFDANGGQSAGKIENLRLSAGGWMQIGSVLAQGAPGLASAFAKVTQTSGGSPFVTYAVINDGSAPGERSGDGAFLDSLPDCPFTITGAPAAAGWSGGTTALSLTTSSRCFWDARTDAPWLHLDPPPIARGSATVSLTVDPNATTAPRQDAFVVAGQAFPLRQLGNGAGAYDGSWIGTTSQSLPVSFQVDRNEVLSFTLGLDVAVAACRATGTFTTSPGFKPVVDGNAFSTTFSFTTSTGTASVDAAATFASSSSAQGTFKVPLLMTTGGTVCLSTGGSGYTFGASR